MARSQFRSRKKPTGGSYKSFRKKKQRYLAGEPAFTKVDEETKVKKARTLGGNEKRKVLKVREVNLIMKDGKAKKVAVKNVVENPANRHYIRRNIITKGAVIETDEGKAVVTSRPGQDGTVNAKQI